MSGSKPKIPHGTQEWANSNANIQNGCEHDCKYCYAKTMAIRFKRATAKSWGKPKLRQHDVDRRYTKRVGRIMFPTAHDITPANLDTCIVVLKRMLAAGNEVLVVSKPYKRCVARLCAELRPYKNRIVFRFSIGSKDDAVLSYWEPGAPTYKERFASLKHAHEAGFQTSISCEPMLDAGIDALIEAVRPYVTDSIWLGKVNRLKSILPHNCPNTPEVLRRAEAFLATQTDTAILELYNRHRKDPLIKWKDSIKAVVGISRPKDIGMDV
jgi:DNA repair photolyase